MSRIPTIRRAAALLVLLVLCGASAACGFITFDERPASGYVYGSGAALRVGVINEMGGTDWTPAILRGVATYGEASPFLQFQDGGGDAHIVVTFRRYSDGAPPALQGYTFPYGVGGFAAVYDARGLACNYPPSPLPRNCSGEIASAYIYLNDAIPPGADIEARRDRLILHELGHAMGLTRHSADLAIEELDARYGWNVEAVRRAVARVSLPRGASVLRDTSRRSGVAVALADAGREAL